MPGDAGVREHRLVLERRRVHLAVAVALEHAAQSVGDRAQLARLVGQHVAGAAGDRMHHRGVRETTRGPARWRHALDARAELAQALVDALVPAVDLADVADLAATLGAQRREQHRHPGADVRRLDALAAQSARAGDDRAVRVAHDDVGAHQDQLVGEDQAVLEHPLVHEDRALGLRGERDRDRGQIGRERRPGTVLDLALVLPHVGLHDELLPAGHEHVVAVELGAQAQALEHEADHAQVAGHGVLDAQLAPR